MILLKNRKRTRERENERSKVICSQNSVRNDEIVGRKEEKNPQTIHSHDEVNKKVFYKVIRKLK